MTEEQLKGLLGAMAEQEDGRGAGGDGEGKEKIQVVRRGGGGEDDELEDLMREIEGS